MRAKLIREFLVGDDEELRDIFKRANYDYDSEVGRTFRGDISDYIKKKESNISQKWTKEIDELFRIRGFEANKLLTVWDEFYSVLTNNGRVIHQKYGDGFEMIDTLKDNSGLPLLFTHNQKTTIYDIVPSLVKNETYQNLALNLCNVKSKGIGVGEVLLTFLFKDSEYTPKHDLLIQNKVGEVKGYRAGIIKANAAANFRIVDKVREKVFDNFNFFKHAGTGGLRYKDLLERKKWWEDNGNEKRAYDYFSQIYPEPTWRRNEINSLVKIFMDNYDNPTELNQLIGIKILQKYKEIDKFDFFVLINQYDGKVIFVNDFTDIDFLMNNIQYTVKHVRKTDTNAVGDGYAIVGGK